MCCMLHPACCLLHAACRQIGAAEESEAQPDAPPALFEFRGMVLGDEHPMPTQQLADPSLYSQRTIHPVPIGPMRHN